MDAHVLAEYGENFPQQYAAKIGQREMHQGCSTPLAERIC
jgi:hypothetical protein